VIQFLKQFKSGETRNLDTDERDIGLGSCVVYYPDEFLAGLVKSRFPIISTLNP
jgi:hypothetical protein